jgi:hypothetical protein
MNRIENYLSENNMNGLISFLVLLKALINEADQSGYGDLPPFSFLTNSYDMKIKIINQIFNYS